VLLKSGKVNPAVNRQYPIRMACKLGHTEVAEILLADNRVDPSAEMNDAMNGAIRLISKGVHEPLSNFNLKQ